MGYRILKMEKVSDGVVKVITEHLTVVAPGYSNYGLLTDEQSAAAAALPVGETIVVNAPGAGFSIYPLLTDEQSAAAAKLRLGETIYVNVPAGDAEHSAAA